MTGNWFFHWPFVRIELFDDRLVLSVRGPLRFLFPFGGPWRGGRLPIVIPLDEIERIDVNWGRFGNATLGRADPALDGLLYFGTFRPRFDRLLEKLRDLGVVVATPE